MEHATHISSQSRHARSKEKGKKKKKAQKGEDASKKDHENQDDKDSYSQLFLSFCVCVWFGAIVASATYIALRISSLVATHKALPIRRPRDRFRTPSEFVSDGNGNLDLKRGPPLLVHTISPSVCEAEMHQEVPESLWPPQAPMGPPEEERRAWFGHWCTRLGPNI